MKDSAVSWDKDDLEKKNNKRGGTHHTTTTPPNHIRFVSYLARVLELVGCHVEETQFTKLAEI